MYTGASDAEGLRLPQYIQRAGVSSRSCGTGVDKYLAFDELWPSSSTILCDPNYFIYTSIMLQENPNIFLL